MMFILKILYNILFLPIASLRLLYKIYCDKSYIKYAKERYGILDKNRIQHYIGNTDILIHVVSLGEFIASEKLLYKLKEKYPKSNIVITCTTPTAREKIEEKLIKTGVFCCYLPYDNYFIINKFIKKISPKVAIFIEKEIWPNLYSCLKKYDSKIVIVNASLSDHSFHNYIPLLSGSP